ncbi:ABC transporter [Legionella taurinensis]|uniref:ABC transporter n=2 Tax=Legionella taurinensis TaxID=70611 RepID=A0A3A5L4E6_9GAMM|nr:ABC transporter ATP-binding protein [Legionella taurinensis]MDX1836154.1 ABC transporter ATP-binding protein [Legionella taurinensis]PUT42075.1 ABC transporter [Legionella taurinensis]PUT44862.1 ABC transporter [Legionella taurinensis]PUT48183.1 ABC transporter [Legionella taurinensis]PUT48997.1 ABC transporter [Legionella taurinensis]
MSAPETLIRLQNVYFTVPSGDQMVSILKDINLVIKAGATIAITGASGSGKTSLLNLMAGLDLPTSGQIYYDTQDITIADEDQRAQLRARNIGFIFQSFHLLPNLTALENVLLPLEINRQYDDPLPVALAWLTKVGLSQRADHYPTQLSGGEQQRVAIARAFAISPRILFADEPTGNLDKQTGRTIIELLFELNRAHQTTLVIVTHDEELARRCQCHWPLVDGQLQC